MDTVVEVFTEPDSGVVIVLVADLFPSASLVTEKIYVCRDSEVETRCCVATNGKTYYG